jgi:hypothetical protein
MRLRVRQQMRARVLQVEPLGLPGHDLAVEQPDDDVQRLGHAIALLRDGDTQHERIRRQQSRPGAEHHAAARHVIELDDAIRDHERLVVRQRHHAGPEADALGALGCRRDEELGRGDDLEARRMMLADPRFLVAQPIEMLDQREVAVDRFGRVFIEGMEGREKDAVAQLVRAHGGWSTQRWVLSQAEDPAS